MTDGRHSWIRGMPDRWISAGDPYLPKHVRVGLQRIAYGRGQGEPSETPEARLARAWRIHNARVHHTTEPNVCRCRPTFALAAGHRVQSPTSGAGHPLGHAEQTAAVVSAVATLIAATAAVVSAIFAIVAVRAQDAATRPHITVKHGNVMPVWGGVGRNLAGSSLGDPWFAITVHNDGLVPVTVRTVALSFEDVGGDVKFYGKRVDRSWLDGWVPKP